jgi:hypothetical protein
MKSKNLKIAVFAVFFAAFAVLPQQAFANPAFKLVREIIEKIARESAESITRKAAQELAEKAAKEMSEKAIKELIENTSEKAAKETFEKMTRELLEKYQHKMVRETAEAASENIPRIMIKEIHPQYLDLAGKSNADIYRMVTDGLIDGMSHGRPARVIDGVTHYLNHSGYWIPVPID